MLQNESLCNAVAETIKDGGWKILRDMKEDLELQTKVARWKQNKKTAKKLKDLVGTKAPVTPLSTITTKLSTPASELTSVTRTSALRNPGNMVPHKPIPSIDGKESRKECDDGRVLHFNGEGQGGAGKSWLLQAVYQVVEELSPADNLMAGLLLFFNKMRTVLPDMVILPINEEDRPPLTGTEQESWPKSGPEAFLYFMPAIKNFARKHNARRAQGHKQAASTKGKQIHLWGL